MQVIDAGPRPSSTDLLFISSLQHIYTVYKIQVQFAVTDFARLSAAKLHY